VFKIVGKNIIHTYIYLLYLAHNEDNFVYNLIRKNELKHQNNNYLDNGFMSDSIQKIEEVEELSKKEKSKKIKPLSGRTIFDYWADFPFPTKYGSGRWKYLNYQD